MKHTWFKCKQPCTKSYCMFCDGGIGYCTVCKGFEGTLTSECCGFELNKYLQDAVYKGGLDYKDGKWLVDNERRREDGKTVSKGLE